MYKPGDVVLIKMHPSSGQELKKFRPAIVLHYYSIRDFATFIPLSSLINHPSPSELLIKPSSGNGLKKSSFALCWYVQTVGTIRIQKQLGRLSKLELKEIFKTVKKHLVL